MRLGAAWLLIACTPSTVSFTYPTSPGANALLLAVEHPDGKTRVFAVDLTDPSAARGPFAEGPIQLTALLYPASLRELGLDPGLVPEVAETEARSPPPWLAAFRGPLDESGVIEWTPLDRGTPLPNIRLPINNGVCTRFSAEEASLESVSRILFGFVVEDRLLLATANAPESSLWIVDGSGARERVAIDPIPDAGFVSGFASGREIYLADARGRIWEGAFEGTRLRLIEIGAHPDGPFGWIGGDPSEMLIVREDGRLDVFDGTAFRTNLMNVRGFDGRIVDASIASVGPDEIVLAASEFYGSPWEAAIYFRYAGGNLGREHPIKSTVGLSVTAHIEGVGDVVGSGTGHIAVFDGSEWIQLDVPTTTRVNAIAPFERGFLYGGDEGTLVQYLPSVGLCPFGHSDAAFPIEIAAALPGAVILARSNIPGGEPALLILR